MSFLLTKTKDLESRIPGSLYSGLPGLHWGTFEVVSRVRGVCRVRTRESYSARRVGQVARATAGNYQLFKPTWSTEDSLRRSRMLTQPAGAKPRASR